MNRFKILSLTIQTTPDPLISRIHRMKALARRLADNTGMRVKGERLYTYIEVSTRTGEKRLFLHILGRWPFIPRTTLLKEWNRLTKSNSLLDVRTIEDERVDLVKKVLTDMVNGKPIPGDF